MFTKDLKFMVVSGSEKLFNIELQNKYDLLNQMGADIKDIKFLNVAQHSWKSSFSGSQEGDLKGELDGYVSGNGNGYFSDGGNGSLDSNMSGKMDGYQEGGFKGNFEGLGYGESFIEYTAIICYVPNEEKEKVYFEEQERLKREEELRLEQEKLDQERKAPVNWNFPEANK